MANPHTSSEPLSHVVLGAAQLGMRYGIANTTGQPDSGSVVAMIEAGWKRGLRAFDTAQAYGTSEAVLGQSFTALGIAHEAEVITKLAPTVRASDPASLIESIRGSLDRLGVPRLAGLMLHREAQLDDWDFAIRPAFERACDAGLIEHAGVSVYSVDRALAALETEGIDHVQVAANLFDRRMQRAGVFERAVELGKTIFVRSVYLQGLVLMSPDAAPATVEGARPALEALDEFCRTHRLDRRQFAVDFIRHHAPQARLVLGAETAAQVEENCALLAAPPLDRELHAAWLACWPDELEPLIDPRLWKS